MPAAAAVEAPCKSAGKKVENLGGNWELVILGNFEICQQTAFLDEDEWNCRELLSLDLFKTTEGFWGRGWRGEHIDMTPKRLDPLPCHAWGGKLLQSAPLAFYHGFMLHQQR